MERLSATRLFSLLKALSRSEWTELETFINSGLTGPTGRSFELLRFLSDYKGRLDDPELTREMIFGGLFPGIKYEDKKLRYAMTDLYRMATNFLKFKSLNSKPELSDVLLQEELARRGADKPYLATYQRDEKEPWRDAGIDALYYHYRHLEEYIYLSDYLPRKQREEHNHLESATRYLDIYYLSRKLQLLCAIVNERNVRAVDYSVFLQDELMQQLKNGAFNDVVLIRCYYLILMTLVNPDDESVFSSLQQLLNNHGKEFKLTELRDMYQYLMNYCIKKINQGNTGYVYTLFGVYKTVLGEKIIFTDGVLSQWDYKNIVVIGIRSGEHDWVQQFIENYKESLREGEQENAYTYNLAYLQFSKGAFRKALSLLRQVEFTDIYYQLDMRAIILKCYYEMDDEEALLYHAAAFRIFISRDKLISDYQRTIYRNLIRFTTAMVKARGNRKRMEQLSEEVNSVRQIADINWLKKSIAEELKEMK